MFAGWFDEDRNRLRTMLIQILAGQTYRARFTPISGDDGILSIPNGASSIDSNGMGQIKIEGANEAHKYAPGG